MTAPSTEQRELDLIEKVDFRILNVANNEAKLQDLLGKYLAPLLLKAGSEHASVRGKVSPDERVVTVNGVKDVNAHI